MLCLRVLSFHKYGDLPGQSMDSDEPWGFVKTRSLLLRVLPRPRLCTWHHSELDSCQVVQGPI